MEPTVDQPQATPVMAEPEKKSSLWVWIVVVVVLLCGCGSIVAIGAWLLTNKSGSLIPSPDGNSSQTESETPGFGNQGNVDLGLPNLGRTGIKTGPSRQVVLSEVELVDESLKILQQKGWSGNTRDQKISANDIPQSTWDHWKTTQEERRSGLTIPDAVLDLYTSPQAQEEIKAAVPKIRAEYLAYIKSQGVSQKYIDEINNHVLPTDSSRYLFHFENDLSADPTSVEGVPAGGDKDYTKLQMHLSVIDFNNGARIFRASGVIGNASDTPTSDMAYEKQLRDLGMRWYIYHELTHVLQRAYLNLHAEGRVANSLTPYEDPRKTTMIADDQYFWKWGQRDPWSAPGQNYDVASESQAEGISFAALTGGYHFSKEQKAAAWEHMFGRLKTAQGLLDGIKRTFESKYPDTYPQDFDNYLDSSLRGGSNDDLVFSLTTRLTIMPSYVGYSHPMLPQDTHKFWAIFRN